MLHTGCPHHYRFAQAGESEEDFATRLAAELEELILQGRPDTVAAFIAEPVMGAGGVIVPPKTYFPKIMAVCARYDVFMIYDEVICGFGRLGHDVRLHGARLQAEFDLGRQGAVVGLSADRRRDGAGGDVSGAARSRAARSAPSATASPIRAIRSRPRSRSRRWRSMPASASSSRPRARRRSSRPGCRARRPSAGRRGARHGAGRRGRACRRQDDQTPFDAQAGVGPRAVRFAEEEGLIVRFIAGDVISICPPLIIKPAEIDELFDRLGRALDRTLDWAQARAAAGGLSPLKMKRRRACARRRSQPPQSL